MTVYGEEDLCSEVVFVVVVVVVVVVALTFSLVSPAPILAEDLCSEVVVVVSLVAPLPTPFSSTSSFS